ncbi:hypothetical protein DFH07DRAFT_846236 [Mycena maculata]|uniref:Uncharacterized protein n=1 Tax=Mycena maculata TaxID=230809 RepID=A0AAD7MVR9_9AGAR|nr:hypothetical protein DFH07DRAFT_846236 [Mycena maculata]
MADELDPIVRQLCSLGSSILSMIEEVEDDESAFKHLVMDTGNLVDAVKRKAADSEGRRVPWLPKRHMESLVSILSSINDFGREHVSRRGIRRMVKRYTDASKIKQYHTQITQSQAGFGFDPQIKSHKDIGALREELSLECHPQSAAAPISDPHAFNAPELACGPDMLNPPPPAIRRNPCLTPMAGSPSPPIAPSPEADARSTPSPSSPSDGDPQSTLRAADSFSYFGKHSNVSIGGNFTATTIYGNQINNNVYETLTIVDSYNSTYVSSLLL